MNYDIIHFLILLIKLTFIISPNIATSITTITIITITIIITIIFLFLYNYSHIHFPIIQFMSIHQILNFSQTNILAKQYYYSLFVFVYIIIIFVEYY